MSVCLGERGRKKERKCVYLHDKGMYKGRWRRIPGALGESRSY